ncbi:hypothetical protein [Altericroceibacterium xinjiangense]|uniref:hypothetical protein n=1 Tax=Altericroceibacterium xinjiangense TaxID=762261 RepID=UPI0019D083CF|nr:hypothetical protein [Altericroceibacterium xinjiangense]
MDDDTLNGRAAPARSRKRTVLGVAIIAFLLGVLAMAALAWQTGYRFGFVTSPTDEVPVGAQTSTPQAARTAEQARLATVAIAQRQGGMDQRVAAMEQRLARLDLQAQAAAGNAGRAEGLLIAFAARRAIERGAPLGYLADQLRLRFGDSRPNAVATVLNMARDPITSDQLISRLTRLAPTLAQAPADEGLFSRIGREVSDLFVIRRDSAPSPAADRRLARARLLLQEGRIEAAISEVRHLPNAAEAADWIADAERYAAAQRALDLLETTAILDPRGLRDRDGNSVVQPSPVVPVDPAAAPRAEVAPSPAAARDPVVPVAGD